jgi:hypothetical protein
VSKPLDTVELHRLMQRYQLTIKSLSKLVGYPSVQVQAWVRGNQIPPVFLRSVIENQEKYRALLPREFRAAVNVRPAPLRKFQRPLPKVD